jgi:hypothetical protein
MKKVFRLDVDGLKLFSLQRAMILYSAVTADACGTNASGR